MDLTKDILEYGNKNNIARSIGAGRTVEREASTVKYNKEFNLYDEASNRFMNILSTAKFILSHPSQDEALAELLDHNKNAFICAITLRRYINNKNIICLYDKHRKANYPASRQGIISNIFGEWVGEDAGRRVFSLLKKKGIIYYSHDVHRDNDKTETMKVFYLNPAFGQKGRKLDMGTFHIFKDTLFFPVLSTTEVEEAIRDLDGKLYNQAVVKKVEDKAVDELLNNIDLSAFGEWVEVQKKKMSSLDIFEKRFLRGSLKDEPKFQKVGNGMIRVNKVDPNKDVYYSVNTVSKDIVKKPAAKDVLSFRGAFIDIDAGRGEDGNYLSETDVYLAKYDMRNIISTLPTPTAVVETRNGYHIYYAIDDIKSAETLKNFENYLVSVVKVADKNCKDVARIMRVPESYWCKDPDNKFKCNFADANDVSYKVMDLFEKFEANKDAIVCQCDQYIDMHPEMKKALNPKNQVIDVDSNERLKVIAESGITANDDLETTYFSNEADAINYLLHNVNLIKYLGLDVKPNKTFSCIFHGDKHPSATIFYNESNGWRYFCNNASCFGNGYTHGICIIDIVERLKNIGYREALKFLFTQYKLVIR